MYDPAQNEDMSVKTKHTDNNTHSENTNNDNSHNTKLYNQH